MACNKIFLLVHAIYRNFLTWPPGSFATSCLFDYVNDNLFLQQEQYNQFNDCQVYTECLTWLLDVIGHKLVKPGLTTQFLFGEVIMLTTCR